MRLACSDFTTLLVGEEWGGGEARRRAKVTRGARARESFEKAALGRTKKRRARAAPLALSPARLADVASDAIVVVHVHAAGGLARRRPEREERGDGKVDQKGGAVTHRGRGGRVDFRESATSGIAPRARRKARGAGRARCRT